MREQGRKELRQHREKQILERYRAIRGITEELCAPLEPEDYIIQSGPDVSPPKWHLAHTTWFFETFILKKYMNKYSEFDRNFGFLYNSYYESVGPFYPRPNRGLLSRPSSKIIMDYRKHVDHAMEECLDGAGNQRDTISFLIEVGLNHEQQHQELLLMDIKQNFSLNPSYYPYAEARKYSRNRPEKLKWLRVEGGMMTFGTSGTSFAFDNETPEHRQYLNTFEIADRPVTNGEFLEFMKDGGYERPEYWLSDGWSHVRKVGWNSPAYWIQSEGNWNEFKLSGLKELDPDEPVCHISFYEADAYARWAGFRLPTEYEWEAAAKTFQQGGAGNFLDNGILHPSAHYEGKIKKMFGDVWEWTASAYLPYPGFKPLEGSLGEYNGKFMSGQMVLRGGSCLTPKDHIRKSYRNFFAPDRRWPVTGLRLARNAE